MKKYIILVISAIVFTFSSCTNSEEIMINYEKKIVISPKSVFSPFQTENEGDFEMSDGEELKITALLYDKNGDLVLKEEGMQDSYNEDFTITTLLPEGEYTLISFSCMRVNGNDSSFDVWEYSDENKMSTLTLEQKSNQYVESMLGLVEEKIIIDNNKRVEETNVELQPALSLLVVSMQNWSISFLDYVVNKKDLYENHYDFLYTTYNTMSYQGGNGWKYDNNELQLDHYYYIPISVDTWMEYCLANDKDFTQSIYTYVTVFPGTLSYACNYSTITNEGYVYEYGFPDKGNVKVEAGKQYEMNVDCLLQTFEFEEKSKIDRSTKGAAMLKNKPVKIKASEILKRIIK